MTHIIRGQGGGSKKRPPSSADDTLKSNAYVHIVDAISEGVVDLVDGERSIYVNRTPLPNIKEAQWQFRQGLPDDEPLRGINTTEALVSVGADISQEIGPIVRSISDTSLDAIKIHMTLNVLYAAGNKGNLTTAATGWDIEIRPAGHTEFIKAHEVRLPSEKTTSAVQFVYEIDLTQYPGPWDIRVSAAYGKRDKIEEGITWMGYSLVTDAKLSYPHTALVALGLSSEHIGSGQVQRHYHVRGRRVKVPSNYDPVARTYAGVWDGSFKIAHSSNPAWVLYDMVDNNVFGLGAHVNAQVLSKWQLYSIAQRCDERVPTGYKDETGADTYEPRFTFNGVITDKKEALDALRTITATWRGMGFYALSQFHTTIDAPADPAFIYGPSNVVEGRFEYSTTSLKARHSVVMVRYNDPNNMFEPAVEPYVDPDLVRQIGWREKSLELAGCSSRSLARRYARWVVETEKSETETVTFQVGLDSIGALPGEVIAINDPRRARIRASGRVVSTTNLSVVLDKPIEEALGSVTLRVQGSDGKLVTFTNCTLSGNTVAIPTAQRGEIAKVEENAVWVVSSALLNPELFRIVSMEENEGASFKITALQYDPHKYDRIERGIHFEPLPTRLPTDQILPPAGISSTNRVFTDGNVIRTEVELAWAPSASSFVREYIVTVTTPSGKVETIGVTTKTSMTYSTIEDGKFIFSVRTLSLSGELSDPINYELTLEGASEIPVGRIANFVNSENLEGPNATFVGDSVTVRWQNLMPVANAPEMQLISIEDSNALYSHTMLEFFFGSTKVRTQRVKGSQFTYTLEMNAADAAAAGVSGAQRQFRIEAYLVDSKGRQSARTTLNLANPAPSAITPVINMAFGEAEITLPTVSDADFKGYVAWLDAVPNFTPTDAKKVWEGTSNEFRLQGEKDQVRFLKVAAYDSFSRANLNPSAAVQITFGGSLSDTIDEMVQAADDAVQQVGNAVSQADAARQQAQAAFDAATQIQTEVDADLAAIRQELENLEFDGAAELLQARDDALAAAATAAAEALSANSFKGEAVTAASNAEAARAAAAAAEANAKDARDAALDAVTSAQTAAGQASSSATSSEAAKTAAETARTAAQTARTQAQTAATNAGNSATAAAGSAQTAATKATEAGNSASAAAASAVTASSKADDADAAADAAATSASSAASFAGDAEQSASAASSSAVTATSKANDASQSANAAATSATTANTKATEASTAASTATSAKTAAETARNAAQSARDAAVTAKETAEAAESTATEKATLAANSATAAGQSASAAASSATTASTKATEASQSATTASTAALTATTKAGEASTSATQAAQSMTDAAGSAQSAATSATTAATALSNLEKTLDAAPVLPSLPGQMPNHWTASRTGAPEAVETLNITPVQDELMGLSGRWNPTTVGSCMLTKGLLPWGQGRVYRLRYQIRVMSSSVVADTIGFNYQVIGLNLDGTLAVSTDNTNAGVWTVPTDGTVVDTEILISDTAGTGITLPQSVVNDAPSVRIGMRNNQSGNFVVHVKLFEIRDVTGEVRSSIAAAAAATSASQAEASNNAAGQSATAAASARTAAETAKGAAETARNEAVSAKNDAVSSATTATTQAGLAATARTNAQNSATAAANSATTASTKATEASQSAQTASTHAQTASTKAGEASNSATQAAQSKADAESSASSASNSATTAANAHQGVLSTLLASSLIPNQFIDNSLWTTDHLGLPTEVSSAAASRFRLEGTTPVFTHGPANAGTQIAPKALIPGGRGSAEVAYRVTIRYKLIGASAATVNLGLAYMKEDGTSFDTVSTPIGATSGPFTGDTEILEHSRIITSFSHIESSAVSARAANAYWLRFFARIGGGSAASITLYSMTIEDVTQALKASASAAAAATSATQAAASSTSAGQQATAASSAKLAAETAKGLAETARNEAVLAKETAEGAATTATTQAGLAATARTNAQNSATAAANSATTATTKATEASQSATVASTQAQTATTKAGEAATSATQAAQSKTDAAGSASSAATSASTAATARTNAQNSATAAATSASNAAASATTASQQASAANTAKLAAETAKGAAETARNEAVTAKNDAQGSASAAATSATTSATALSNAQLAANNVVRALSIIPGPNLGNIGTGSTGLPASYTVLNSSYNTDATHGPYVRRAATSNGAAIFARALVPSSVDRVYRVTARVRAIGGSLSLRLHTRWIKADGTSLANAAYKARTTVEADGVVTITMVLGRVSGGLVDQTGGSEANWRDAIGIRFGVDVGTGVASTSFDLFELTVDDLTEADKAARQADNAAGSATAAATSATQAAASNTAAGQSASAASTAKTAAETAKTAAESARTAAVAAKETAESAATTATNQATLATTARTNAQNSATAAADSASTASSKATEAGQKATSATTSANTATTKAGEASSSASAAATSASNAAGSATTASQQATLATSAKSAAQVALANATNIFPIKPIGAAGAFGTGSTGLPEAYTPTAENNSAFQTDATHGAFFRRASTSAGAAVYHRGLAATRGGAGIYKIRAKLRNGATAQSLRIRIVFIKADGTAATTGYYQTTAFAANEMKELSCVIGRVSGGLVTQVIGSQAQWDQTIGLRIGVDNSTAGTNFDMFELEVQDLSEADAAARSATAAAGSASAASGSASTASTKANEASASATAANSAKVATLIGGAVLMPATMAGDGAYFTHTITGDQGLRYSVSGGWPAAAHEFVQTDKGIALRLKTSTANLHVSMRQYLNPVAGHRYRVEMVARHAGAFGTNTNTALQWLIRSMNTSTWNSQTDISTASLTFSAINTWQTFSLEFDAGTHASVLIGCYVNGTKMANMPAASGVEIASITLTDITSEKAAQTAATTAQGHVTTASNHAASALTYSNNAARLTSGGVSKNPTFNIWTGTYPTHMAGAVQTGNTIAKVTGDAARYQNAVRMVGGTALTEGPHLRLETGTASHGLDCSKSPEAVLVRVELTLEAVATFSTWSGTLAALWQDNGTNRWTTKPLRELIKNEIGTVQVIEFYMKRPASWVGGGTQNFQMRIMARGASGTGGTILVHRFDFEEVHSQSLTAITQQAAVDVKGMQNSLIGLRAVAGTAGAELELAAVSSPTGTSSMARISAARILLEGSVDVGLLNVKALEGGRISADYIDVNKVLTIGLNAGLSYGKSRYNEDNTDGLFIGSGGTANTFGFAASRTASGKRQSIKLTKETGLQLLNARHYVSGASLPVSVDRTTNLAKTNLPADADTLVLDIYGGGASGNYGKYTVTNWSGGKDSYSTISYVPTVGNSGGTTTVKVYDGSTLKQTYTAAGGVASLAGSGSGAGQGTIFGAGGSAGYQTTHNDRDGSYTTYTAAGAAVGAGAGGGGGSAMGGVAGARRTVTLDISGYAAPAIEITIGAGGAASGPSGSDRKGGAGKAGGVRYSTQKAVDIPADVVPLVPTATGRILKNSASITFPALGTGLWTISDEGSENMDLGKIEISPGVEVNMRIGGCMSFFASQTPVYKSNGYNATRGILYAFYSMGNWG